MLIGFIAVVVVLLIIVGIMAATGGGQDGKIAQYNTEAKRTLTIFNNIEADANMYYVIDESYTGYDTAKAVERNVAVELQGDTATDGQGKMLKAEWTGWPAVLPDPTGYEGTYLKVGGSAGDDLRILVLPIEDGKTLGIFLIKRNSTTVDEVYYKILETTISNAKSNFLGA